MTKLPNKFPMLIDTGILRDLSRGEDLYLARRKKEKITELPPRSYLKIKK